MAGDRDTFIPAEQVWPNITEVGKPPVCVKCRLPILPYASGRGEAPATHMRYVGVTGPFHIGCAEVTA